jgi:hypothetical protein
MFEDIKQKKIFDISNFHTREEFSMFMFSDVFTGKALGKDIDIAEVVAGNEEYCRTRSIDDIH